MTILTRNIMTIHVALLILNVYVAYIILMNST